MAWGPLACGRGAQPGGVRSSGGAGQDRGGGAGHDSDGGPAGASGGAGTGATGGDGAPGGMGVQGGVAAEVGAGAGAGDPAGPGVPGPELARSAANPASCRWVMPRTTKMARTAATANNPEPIMRSRLAVLKLEARYRWPSCIDDTR